MRSANFLLAGLAALAFAVASPASAATPAATVSSAIATHIAEAAERFAIPERWIRAVMQAESAGQIRAVSRAGAMGLMQIMPSTWAELRTRHRLGSDPFEPRANILAGAAYLRAMLDRYGDPQYMLAAYNAGPNRLDQHLAGKRFLPTETRAYLTKLTPVLGDEQPAIRSSIQPADWRQSALFASSNFTPPIALEAGAEEPRTAAFSARQSGIFVP